jgi:hypothetical protein
MLIAVQEVQEVFRLPERPVEAVLMSIQKMVEALGKADLGTAIPLPA